VQKPDIQQRTQESDGETQHIDEAHLLGKHPEIADNQGGAPEDIDLGGMK
jgi:hypothetical protein